MRASAMPTVDPPVEPIQSNGNDWKLLSSELQMSLAEQLDQYAQFLEMGDEAAAESFLRSHPGLVQSMGAHVDDLKLLCQIRRDNDVNSGVDLRQRPEEAGHRLERGEVFGNDQTLGDYQIRREIGRGGMGIVYEATQLSLRRNVALKTLPFAAVLDQQQVARFRNEAQAAASLHHPHIVPVFAVGCERGVHYFSMQLINGQTLEQTLSELMSKDRSRKISERLSEMRLQNAQQSMGNTTTMLGAGGGLQAAPAAGVPTPSEPPRAEASETVAAVSTKINARGTSSTIESVRDRTSIRQLIEITIRVADALEYAHQQGVIHRDIKPSNLLIDEAGKIWVADFGLARCRGLSNLTADNKVMGTVRYMSPEQVAGRTHEIDHRTDIYSLGITFYEMLTLQPAYLGNDRDRLMRAVEVDAPVPPRRLNPSIAVDLETIMLKAIAKSKQDRYATAGEFKDDLQRFLDGHAPLAKRPTALDLGFKWAMRRRRLMLASVSALLLLIAALATSNAIVAKHSAAKDQANEQARFHLHQAHAAVDRFGGLMADRLSDVEGGDVLRSELLQEARRYYTDFIRYAQADSRYDRELAKIHFQLGAVQSRLGAKSLAEDSYRQSISMFENLATIQASTAELLAEHASCLHNLASLQKDQGRYAEAKLTYRDALSHLEKVLTGPSPPAELVSQWAATQCNFAILTLECGEAESAVPPLDAAVSKLQGVLASNPDDTRARQQLAECRSALVGAILDSDTDRAEELLSQTIADLQSLMTMPASPTLVASSSSLSVPCQLAVAKNNLATLRGKQNRTNDAIRNVREAIQALQQAVESRPADRPVRQHLAIAQNNLGQLHWSQNEVAEATDAFSQSEANFRHVIAADSSHPQALSRLAGVLHNQSVLQVDCGEWEQAVQRLTQAMDFQATAVRTAPFNAGYRQYLELHRELLDRVLKHLRQRSALTESGLNSSLTVNAGD